MEIKTKFDIGEELYCVPLFSGDRVIKKARVKNLLTTYELEDVENERKDFYIWIVDEKDNCLYKTKKEAEQRLQEILVKESMKNGNK